MYSKSVIMLCVSRGKDVTQRHPPFILTIYNLCERRGLSLRYENIFCFILSPVKGLYYSIKPPPAHQAGSFMSPTHCNILHRWDDVLGSSTLHGCRQGVPLWDQLPPTSQLISCINVCKMLEDKSNGLNIEPCWELKYSCTHCIHKYQLCFVLADIFCTRWHSQMLNGRG